MTDWINDNSEITLGTKILGIRIVKKIKNIKRNIRFSERKICTYKTKTEKWNDSNENIWVEDDLGKYKQ